MPWILVEVVKRIGKLNLGDLSTDGLAPLADRILSMQRQ